MAQIKKDNTVSQDNKPKETEAIKNNATVLVFDPVTGEFRDRNVGFDDEIEIPLNEGGFYGGDFRMISDKAKDFTNDTNTEPPIKK